MTANKTRKQRLENFKTDHLLREGAMRDSVDEELSRLSKAESDLLNNLDEQTRKLVFSLIHNSCEYKTTLRLALTITDKSELPEHGPDLVRHCLKVAQDRYGMLSNHSEGTQRSNRERAKHGVEIYRPFLLKAYFSHLRQHAKPPGRSKLEYLAREAMRKSRVPRKKWDGLTEYVVKQFLADAIGNPWYRGKGLIGRMITQNFS